MARPVDHGRREALLHQALPYLAEHGLAGMSLRPLAAALGTSDRMLIHYFGNKENLVGLVLAASRPDVSALLGPPSPAAVERLAHLIWTDLAGGGPQEPRVRVLLEVMGLALAQPELYGTYAAAAVHAWVQPLADAIYQCHGVSRAEADARATVLVSGLRGLALDRYLTRDRARTQRAAALLIDSALHHPWAGAEHSR